MRLVRGDVAEGRAVADYFEILLELCFHVHCGGSHDGPGLWTKEDDPETSKKELRPSKMCMRAML